jgi:23S rRNA (cytidine1920-2'-O)/16S rRNA (cytidine1409-2'-O)-methyltransferase
VSGFR